VNHSIYTSNNGSSIIVDFKLKRIISYHMTNTFLPTTTLLIITEVTLLFDQSKMEAAIGLSLTVFLVMYTIYQSITLAVTKTAYLKMLDYWLLFCLLVPFIIFMIEIYWFLRSQKKLTIAPNQNFVKKNNFVNRKTKQRVQILTYGSSFVFFAVYFCIASMMFNEVI